MGEEERKRYELAEASRKAAHDEWKKKKEYMKQLGESSKLDRKEKA